jgi:hypothetical protein
VPDTEFDANDRIAGFSLVRIKGALFWTGMLKSACAPRSPKPVPDDNY